MKHVSKRDYEMMMAQRNSSPTHKKEHKVHHKDIYDRNSFKKVSLYEY